MSDIFYQLERIGDAFYEHGRPEDAKDVLETMKEIDRRIRAGEEPYTEDVTRKIRTYVALLSDTLQ